MEASDDTNQLVIDIKEALQIVPPLPTECCIYKVPGDLRSENEAAYKPKIISIGPLHHGDANLNSMEIHKRRYLTTLLRRNPNIGLEDCVNIIRGLEGRARNNYHEEQYGHSFSSDEFVAMMLQDSCFIIELLLSMLDPKTADKYDLIIHSRPYSDNVYNDILLLENQLPFFLLDQLYNFINGPEKKCSSLSFPELSEYHLPCYGEGHRTVRLRNPVNSQAKHFIDFVLNNHLPSDKRRPPNIRITEVISLPSATELHEAGVKFKARNGAKLLDIRFRNGLLEIPTLCFDDNTEYRFKNMIAMEQCHPGNTSHITDYMILMDFLVNNANDVAILRSSGIIKNYLGSDDVVAYVLNNIVKGANRDLEESYYYALFQDVNVFYNRRWNVWGAKLRRDYFNNPWAIISFIAALVLLGCTLLQTTISVFQWK